MADGEEGMHGSGGQLKAGGTHPTGMHSCFQVYCCCVYIINRCFVLLF